MEPDQEQPFVLATYDEIRLRFGLGSADHARMKAKRRKWEIEPRNHPGALARVRVPRAEWDAAVVRERAPGTDTSPDPEQSYIIKAFEGAVAVIRQDQERLTAERDVALARLADEQARVEEHRARAEVIAAQFVVMQLREAVAEARREAPRSRRRSCGTAWRGQSCHSGGGGLARDVP